MRVIFLVYKMIKGQEVIEKSFLTKETANAYIKRREDVYKKGIWLIKQIVLVMK